MDRLISLIMASILCIFLAICLQSAWGQDGGILVDQNDISDQNNVDAVIIALTHLNIDDLSIDVNDQILDPNGEIPDVNDPTLKLRWKIKNNSDQDIWVCNGVGWIGFDADEDDGPNYEAHFEEEEQILLIRRRLDVLMLLVYYIWPDGRYVRLRAGEEMTDSISLALPIHYRSLFIPRLDKPGVIYPRRLLLEIGFHTKDLVQLIMDSEGINEDPNKYDRCLIPGYSHLNTGEHVLQVTVDGVLIPYEEIRLDEWSN